LNFTGINGYTATGDGMSQKFNGIQPKFTLGEFGIQVVVLISEEQHGDVSHDLPDF
jgi:hypothetical protein